MRTRLLSTLIICITALQLQAQMNKEYVPCNDMPNIIQNYYADIMALDRVYVAEGSPEIRERYKKVQEEYLARLEKINFASLPQGCKADYILFKRDVKEQI